MQQDFSPVCWPHYLLACGAMAGFMPPQEQILSDMVLANHHFTNEWPVPAAAVACQERMAVPSGPGERISRVPSRIPDQSRSQHLQLCGAMGIVHQLEFAYGDRTTRPMINVPGRGMSSFTCWIRTRPSRLTHIANNVNFWMKGNLGLSTWTYVDSIHMSMAAFAKLSVS